MHKEFVLASSKHSKPLTFDLHWEAESKEQPLILFLHGFKGFKDWGPFNEIARQFARAGFVFAKMNFSHNGVTPEKLVDFADLEAFGHNNFALELGDVQDVLDYLLKPNEDLPKFDKSKLGLLAHSRGGATAIITASEDSRIKKLATLASVNGIKRYANPAMLDAWKKRGVYHIHNGRTGQDMPLYYQLVEDILGNEERYDVGNAFGKLTIPTLLIHGTKDPTVPVQEALSLKAKKPDTDIELVEGGDHTFGGSHPFNGSSLPDSLQKVTNRLIDFYRFG